MPKTALKLEDFDILQTIGTGTFGVCKKVRRKSDGKVFVWKEIDYGGMTEKEKQLLVQEVNLLREFKHSHIVRYYDRIIARTEATIFIIMEYCEGGDLASLIGRCRAERRFLEEGFVWKVFHQVLLALEECHRKRTGVHKVLHRDLKPANVFLDSSCNVKLGDFGLARILHHNFSLAKTFVGTPYYMSPEQLDEQGYDEKSDLWSLGCLLYELCALSPPFNAPNQRVLGAKVRQGRFRRIPAQYSGELQSIIASLLQIQPSLRPDIPSLLQKSSTHIPTPTPTSAPGLAPGHKRPSREERATSSEQESRQQQPAIRQQQPAVRQEQPVPRQQQPAIRQQQPAVRQEQPVPRQQQPATRQQQPAVRQEQPVPRQQQPAIRQQQPAVRQEQPVPRQQQPAIRQQQPAVRQEQPVPRQQQPATRQQQPAVRQEQPVPRQQQLVPKQQGRGTRDLAQWEGELCRWEEVLRRREEGVRARERVLQERERQLAVREKAVRECEQLLARHAERHHHFRAPLEVLDSNLQRQPRHHLGKAEVLGEKEKAAV